MIVLTGRDTCSAAYVPEDYIEKIEEKVDKTQERDYPFSRIHIRIDKDSYDYYIDVVESKAKIQQIIKETHKNEKMKRKDLQENETEQ